MPTPQRAKTLAYRESPEADNLSEDEADQDDEDKESPKKIRRRATSFPAREPPPALGMRGVGLNVKVPMTAPPASSKGPALRSSTSIHSDIFGGEDDSDLSELSELDHPRLYLSLSPSLSPSRSLSPACTLPLPLAYSVPSVSGHGFRIGRSRSGSTGVTKGVEKLSLLPGVGLGMRATMRQK